MLTRDTRLLRTTFFRLEETPPRHVHATRLTLDQLVDAAIFIPLARFFSIVQIDVVPCMGVTKKCSEHSVIMNYDEDIAGQKVLEHEADEYLTKGSTSNRKACRVLYLQKLRKKLILQCAVTKKQSGH